MAISEKIQKRINRLTGGASLPAAMPSGAGALVGMASTPKTFVESIPDGSVYLTTQDGKDYYVRPGGNPNNPDDIRVAAMSDAFRSSKALNPDSEKISDLSAPIVENLASSDMAKFVTELQNQMPSFGRGGYQLPPSRGMARLPKGPYTDNVMRSTDIPESVKIGDMPQEGGPMMFQALQDMKGQMSSKDMQVLRQQMENAELKANAPLSALAEELAMQGDGEDTQLAHLRPGEIVMPPEFMEDAQFEAAVENKFNQFGINPEKAVVGTGIASLNQITGLEEFGFFKKLGKSLKKVVKKVAPYAAVIPGPWQAPAIVYNKGSAALRLAKGEGGIGDLATVMAGGSQKVFGPDGALKSVTSGDFLNAGGGFGDSLRAIGSVGGEFKPLQYASNIGQQYMDDQKSGYFGLFGGGGEQPVVEGEGQQQGGSFFGMQTPDFIKNIGDRVGFGGMSGLQDVYGENFMGGGQQQVLYDAQGNPVQVGGGGMSPLGMLGIGGLAAGLGKLAYEDAKKQTGVPLTPLTTMSPTGRYNIEAEIAKRMGQSAPNPVEFGLLPEGTIPQLSGGMPAGMMYGGPVMAYAEGGAVQMQEGGEMNPSQFPRMDGDINGPGTETSDDIPAMLSDGEFVMTGKAVRGAGSYNMEQGDGGIISLVPSYDESRERGMDLMYQMMDVFANNARSA